MLRLPVSGASEETTTNTIYAAAFAALGMRVRTWRNHDLQSGVEGMAFSVSAEAVGNPVLQTAVLHWALIRGTLDQTDPRHPLLYAIRTLRNRAAILRWIKRCQPYRLAISGPRSIYTPGADQVAFRAEFKTDDLHLVAALGALGVPLVKFTGITPNHVFWTPLTGLSLDGYACDVKATVTALRDGSLLRDEPDHPLHICLRACEMLDRLKVLMSRECVILHYHDTKYQSGGLALLRQDSENKAYDNSRAWFASKPKPKPQS